MGMIKCSDCDGERIFDPDCGDGKCSDCHGTGLELDPLTAFTEALSGQSQKCDTCGGTGECQTCYGKGYLNV